jgi:hypothetical protein
VRARARAERRALTLDTIGVVMTRAGAHAESVELPARVARDASKAAYHYNRRGAAVRRRLRGRPAALRAALALDPAHYRAWSRAGASRAPAALWRRVAELERQLAAGALSEDAGCTCATRSRSSRTPDVTPIRFSISSRGKARKRAAVQSFEAHRELFDAAARTASAGAAPRSSPLVSSAEPISSRRHAAHRHDAGRADPVEPPGSVRGRRARQLRAARAETGGGHAVESSCSTPRRSRRPSASIQRALGEAYVASTRPRTGHTPRFIDKMP